MSGVIFAGCARITLLRDPGSLEWRNKGASGDVIVAAE